MTYSVRFAIDHRALVSDGKSLSSARDVRIAWWTGVSWAELDRVLGLESSWNEADSVIWFRPAALRPGVDDSHYLYYGDPSADPAPRNPNAVFVFYDGFESSDLGGWTSTSLGQWETTSEQARTGTRSMRCLPTDEHDVYVVADGLEESDLAFDAFWRMSTVQHMDLAQAVRMHASPIGQYETNHEGTDGWNISKIVDGGWSELVTNPPGQHSEADEWTRITVTIIGEGVVVYRDGVQLVPTTGVTSVGGELPSGSVGFRAWRLPENERWWIDDVRVRRLIDPEPTVEVGPEEVAPFSSP